MRVLSLFDQVITLILLCSAVLLFLACSSDDPVQSEPSWHWSALGDGVSGEVWGIEMYSGQFYAGGWFSQYNGVRVLSGRQWVSFGDSISGTVYDLGTYDNRLIATGDFTYVGSREANGIAAWNGHSWTTLGSGLPDGMAGARMAVYNGKLVVGNMYWSDNMYIIAWDGSSWTIIKSGGIGMVFDMCVYNGELVVVGDSCVNRGSYVSSYPWVRSWNGTSWKSMSSGMGSPRALAVMDDTLYMAADLAPYLKAWTGSTWASRSSASFVDDEHSAAVYRLATQDGKLVIGGDFTSIDGDTIMNITTWDRDSFSSITTGLTGQYDPVVHVLKCVNGRLFVGGRFSNAGEAKALNIAEWSYR